MSMNSQVVAVLAAMMMAAGCGGAAEVEELEVQPVPAEEGSVTGKALQCVMFKGLDMNGQPAGYQKCGSYGQWVASTYAGYQQPRVDGTLPMNGVWASYNNDLVRYTTSAATRNSYFSNVPSGRLFGTCSGCVF